MAQPPVRGPSEVADSALKSLFAKTETPQQLVKATPVYPRRPVADFSPLKVPDNATPEEKNACWLGSAVWSSALDDRLFALSQQIALLRDPDMKYPSMIQIGVDAAVAIQLVSSNMFERDDNKALRKYRKLLADISTIPSLGVAKNGMNTFESSLLPDLLIGACVALDPLEPLLWEAYHREQKMRVLGGVVAPELEGRPHPLSLWVDLATYSSESKNPTDLGPLPPTRLAFQCKVDVLLPEDGILFIWAGGLQVKYKMQCLVQWVGGLHFVTWTGDVKQNKGVWLDTLKSNILIDKPMPQPDALPSSRKKYEANSYERTVFFEYLE